MRSHLVRQFLSESVLLSMIATVLALISAWLLLAPFNNLAGKEISATLFLQPWFLLSLLGFMLLVGLLAGSYPASYLSSFPSGRSAQGQTKSRDEKQWYPQCAGSFSVFYLHYPHYLHPARIPAARVYPHQKPGV